jgi:hypothetical protein
LDVARAVQRMVIGDAAENIGQPCLRIDALSQLGLQNGRLLALGDWNGRETVR